MNIKFRFRQLYTRFIQKYDASGLISRFFTLLSIDILVKASGFILLPIYLRLMTKEEFGTFSYIISIIGMFTAIFTFGFHVAIGKLYLATTDVKYRGELLFTVSIMLSTIIAIVYAFVLVFDLDVILVHFLFKNEFNYAPYRISVLSAIPISVITGLILNFLINSKKIASVTKYNTSKLIAVNLIPIIALFIFQSNADIVRLQFLYLAELIILLLFLSVPIKEFTYSFNIKIAKKAMLIAFPYFIGTLPSMFFIFIDKFILEKFVTFSDLSIYYLAFAIAGILSILAASFNNAWFPEIFSEQRLEIVLSKTKFIIKRLFIIYLVIGIILVFASYLALSFNLFEKEYYEILYLLPILLIGQIFNIIAVQYSFFILYLGKTYWYVIINYSILFPILIINLFLISKYGYNGAAYSYLSSGIINFVFYFLLINYLSKKTKIN